ncbi:MAG: class I SAM-dependent methyltransferase [Anaerolineae bacterium]|nr:class I SAM-dependent methyltransferase [Anaerolineae bacterium]
MTTRNYDYYGMVASTWDLGRSHIANWPDRSFYLEIIRRYGEPVLDLGCGTGRLILDYLQQGIDIDGMDNSPEMIAICRAKAEALKLSPNLYQQEMQTLDLPRKYRTIIGPSSVLQLLTNRDTALEAVQHLFAHLQPGGVFVTPFYFDWAEGEPTDYDWRLRFEKVRPEDGAVVRSWVHSWCEPARQWWHMEERFEVELNGKIIDREEHRQSPELRWYTQAEARQMYQEAGFTNIQLFHQFELNPASADDRQFCMLGVKPENSSA